jgi:hypothetical protein
MLRGHSGTLAQASYLSLGLGFRCPELRILATSARTKGSVILTGTPCSAHDRSTQALARSVQSSGGGLRRFVMGLGALGEARGPLSVTTRSCSSLA